MDISKVVYMVTMQDSAALVRGDHIYILGEPCTIRIFLLDEIPDWKSEIEKNGVVEIGRQEASRIIRYANALRLKK